MTASTSRRFVWGITVVGIAVVAWTFFTMSCPARLSLEKLGAVPADRILPDVRGEARCWTFFVAISAGLITFAALGTAAITRHERRAGRRA